MRSRLPWLPPLLLGVLWLAAFGIALGTRLPYPYDLEWMEGGMLAHALHLRQLYGPPRTEFVPFVYPPGFPALLALVGPSPLTGRLIALLGSLAAAASIAAWPRDRLLGATLGISFLATWHAGGAFFDLVRPDGLALGLLALGLTAAWHDRRGSAPLWVAAFLVKHSTAFFLPAVWWLAYRRGGVRGAGRSVALTAGPILGLTVLLQLVTDGYFLTYLLEVPTSHPLVTGRLFPLAWLELGGALPFTTLAAAVLVAMEVPEEPRLALPVAVLTTTAAILLTGTQGPTLIPQGMGLCSLLVLGVLGAKRFLGTTPRQQFLTLLGACALVSTVWMRAHHGGYVNVLMPGFWVLAVLAAVLLDGRRWASAVITLQLAWQLWTTPFAALSPTPADRAAGDALVERLKHIEGPVWSPYAVWLPTYAGHAPQAHLIAVWDLDHPEGPLYQDVQLFTDAMRDRHWGAVITSQRKLGYGLDAHYELRTRLHHGPTLRPKSGWPVGLQEIWVRRH